METITKPLVSIVTGYYNRKDYLKECITSILAQTYTNFEYIVFDDCSTDGTYEMLMEFSDPRLRVIRHETNMGFTKGIIAAIAQSKGELIAIQGAGDISKPTRIERQVEFLNLHPEVGIVGCLVEDVSPEETIIHSPVVENKGNHYFTQGEVMYRKSLYFQIGGYNAIFIYGQFTNLKHEILKLSKAGHVDEVLYKRIHHKNGVTKNAAKNIEQEIYYKIGLELSRAKNVLYLDTAAIAMKVCLKHFSRLQGTPQESIIVKHLEGKRFAKLIYKLYKAKLLPETITIKLLYRLAI